MDIALSLVPGDRGAYLEMMSRVPNQEVPGSNPVADIAGASNRERSHRFLF